MKSRTWRFRVLAAILVGLLAPMVTPAAATTVKTITFQGTAILGHGLGYPGIGLGGQFQQEKVPCTEDGFPDPDCFTVKTGPKGEAMLNFNPEGNHSGFAFGSSNCVKTSASTDPAKKFPGPALCTMAGAGVIWGYCGLSTGLGVVTVTNEGVPPLVPPFKNTLSLSIKFTGLGGLLYVTGGDDRTNITATVLAIPDGGCPTKTASTFHLLGEATVKDLT